jgi:hypothetical protein
MCPWAFSKCEVRALLIYSLFAARSGAMTRSIAINQREFSRRKAQSQHLTLNKHYYTTKCTVGNLPYLSDSLYCHCRIGKRYLFCSMYCNKREARKLREEARSHDQSFKISIYYLSLFWTFRRGAFHKLSYIHP